MTNLIEPPLMEAREITRKILREVDKSIGPSASKRGRDSRLWREWKKRLKARLGSPLPIGQKEWRAFGEPGSSASLPWEIQVEIELRYLILAYELNVDIDGLDRDWR